MNANANALVLQSGGCTPVLNSSLFGVFSEASGASEIGEIYGARHGVEGLLAGDWVDLRRQAAAVWRRLAKQPAAVLGTSRHSPSSDELDMAMTILRQHGVRFLFIIGGNDSAETGLRIAERAAAARQPVSVLNVPKTIDNDLVLTDHTPGYGSTARFVALATLGAGLDAESMARDAPITVMEVMGRDAGWLAAASSLARREERDAPHVLGLPEVPVDEVRLLTMIEEAYRSHGFAVAVVAENTRSTEGVLGESDQPYYVDPFGHPYHDGPARYLARRLSQRLRVRVRHQSPGTVQRSFMGSFSRVDVREAEMAGRAAVRAALEGRTGFMVTLVRVSRRPYRCETGLAPLEQVAGAVRAMPEEYLDRERYFVTPAFRRYVRPLLGGRLPAATRLT